MLGKHVYTVYTYIPIEHGHQVGGDVASERPADGDASKITLTEGRGMWTKKEEVRCTSRPSRPWIGEQT